MTLAILFFFFFSSSTAINLQQPLPTSVGNFSLMTSGCQMVMDDPTLSPRLSHVQNGREVNVTWLVVTFLQNLDISQMLS